MLLMNGKDTKDIASELFLSAWTVRNYIHMIMRKLNVKTRIDVVNMARKMEYVWRVSELSRWTDLG
nr:LuxR C-terminal-related transcriptional regulator [Baia soyae]